MEKLYSHFSKFTNLKNDNHSTMSFGLIFGTFTRIKFSCTFIGSIMLELPATNIWIKMKVNFAPGDIRVGIVNKYLIGDYMFDSLYQHLLRQTYGTKFVQCDLSSQHELKLLRQSESLLIVQRKVTVADFHVIRKDKLYVISRELLPMYCQPLDCGKNKIISLSIYFRKKTYFIYNQESN